MAAKSFDPIDLGPIRITFSVDAEMSNGSATVSRCDVAAGSGIPVAHSHDAFEETGYLERVDDSEDRRSKRVRITERGWAAGEVMRTAVGGVEQEFVDAHGKKELANLLELLTHLNVVLGTWPAG